MRTLASFFFLATIFCCTFEKIHWSIAGSVGIADMFAILFLVCFADDLVLAGAADDRASRSVSSRRFMLVYLIGFFNLETSQALAQFVKGMVKFVIHFLFLAAAVAWLARRGQRFYWRTFAWFCGGIAVNALYGVFQLLDARRGGNLDALVLSPITGGASQINIYGAVEGANVYRPNALTGDPNHSGSCSTSRSSSSCRSTCAWRQGTDCAAASGSLIAFLLIVEAATLSRSGMLGPGVGALILAVPYRRLAESRALLVPVGALALLCVVSPRTGISSRSCSLADRDGRQLDLGALQVYALHPATAARPPAVRSRPEQLLGLLPVRHRQDELGAALVLRRARRGDGRRRHAVFVAFLWYVFRRLRRLGRSGGRSPAPATRSRRGCGRSPGG